MALAIGDLVKLGYYSTQADQTAINFLSCKVVATAGVSLTEQQVATQHHADVKTNFVNLLTVNAAFRGVSCQRMFPGPVGAPFYSSGASAPGTVAGDALPWQCASVVSKKTALAGRRNRGRFYFPFPGEADSDASGRPNVGYQLRLGLFFGQISNPFVVIIGGDGVTFRPGVSDKNFSHFEELVTYVSALKWGTQRRRGQYGRPNPPPW